MNLKINNIDELKAEIVRLNMIKFEQEAYLGSQYQLLKHKVSAPMRIYNSLIGSVPGLSTVKGLFSNANEGSAKKSNADWLTRILQFGVPLVINRTFLKKSGWLKKSLVLIASETAAGQVNKGKVSSMISKITDLIRPKKKKRKNIKYESPILKDTGIRVNHDKIKGFEK